MPRKSIIRSNEHYYHVVARCNNKEPFPLPIEEVWDIAIKRLRSLQLEFKLQISAFVLMNNHFHLLLLTPEEDIDRVMYFLMKKLTLVIQKKSGRINRIFGGRYKGCLIENERYLMNVYKYIYRNPVAANLCDKSELYPYSTLFYKVQGKRMPLEVTNLFDLGCDELEWLNQTFQDREVESVRFGLSKTIFQYKQNRNSRVIVAPELPEFSGKFI